MKTTILLFICVFFIGLELDAQESDYYKLFRDMNINADEVKVDEFGHFYMLHLKRSELIKMDESGSFLHRFNDYRYGKMSSFDITNPLKILVFYPDFSVILVLDNKLSIIGEISLEEYGYVDVQHVCLSNDNHIWIYSPLHHRLIKINQSGETLISTNDLQIELGYTPMPINISERNNRIFLLDKNGTIHTFNQYGRYAKSRSLDARILFPTTNQMFYMNGENLVYKYDDRFQSNKEYPLPEHAENKMFSFSEFYCIYADSSGIRGYKFRNRSQN